jgi:hypothetical protein
MKTCVISVEVNKIGGERDLDFEGILRTDAELKVRKEGIKVVQSSESSMSLEVVTSTCG